MIVIWNSKFDKPLLSNNNNINNIKLSQVVNYFNTKPYENLQIMKNKLGQSNNKHETETSQKSPKRLRSSML